MLVQVGDLVYITSDGSKTHAHNWYLVVSVDGLWCNVHKFTDSQLSSTSYRVKLSECYRVPDLTETTPNLSRRYSPDCYPEDIHAGLAVLLAVRHTSRTMLLGFLYELSARLSTSS